MPAGLSNTLFPIFLKLEQMRVTMIGGGMVATEKLMAIAKNAPGTRVKVIASWFCDDIQALAAQHPAFILSEKLYDINDLADTDILFVAINDKDISAAIHKDAVTKKILTNVADKPELCDFYLGSIVQKGELKIAISTNGKSPTLAKRLKEAFQEALPGTLEELMDNLHEFRKKLQGDFTDKVNKLNELTKQLISEQTQNKK
jgi:siroheme synthase-like protein